MVHSLIIFLTLYNFTKSMFSRIMHPLSSHKIHLDGLWEKTPLQLEMYDDSSAALCLRAHWVLIASCQFVMSHIRQGEACTFETNLTRLRSANITETHLSISLNMFIPKCYKFRISESFLQPTNQPTNQPTDFTSEISFYINKYKHSTFQSITSIHLNINEL